MPNKNSLDARIEAADANWANAVSGCPENDSVWGFFSYGDAPGGIGGGFGAFTWFIDRDSMLDFIASTLPYSPGGSSTVDPQHVATETTSIIERLREGRISDLDGLGMLNQVLKTCSQLTWLGTVNDLLSGDHPYAQEVRAAFRDEGDNPSDSSPIHDSEKEAFFEFLETWGI